MLRHLPTNQVTFACMADARNLTTVAGTKKLPCVEMRREAICCSTTNTSRVPLLGLLIGALVSLDSQLSKLLAELHHPIGTRVQIFDRFYHAAL